MNRDLIEFYESEQKRIQKEIEELWEVRKKSNRRVKRLIEIEYILDGLNCEEELVRLRNENMDLRKRLINEGIDLYE